MAISFCANQIDLQLPVFNLNTSRIYMYCGSYHVLKILKLTSFNCCYNLCSAIFI